MSTDIEKFNQVEAACEPLKLNSFLEVAEIFCPDRQYIQLANGIQNSGSNSGDRTCTGTKKIVGAAEQFPNINFWFPILEAKKVNFDAVIDELCWFIRGDTNTATLNSKIWDNWADADGNLGPIYGKQWRKWVDTRLLFTGNPETKAEYDKLIARGYKQIASFEAGDTGYDELVMRKEYDQLQTIVDTLKSNPDSRRILCSSWNVVELDDMALMPCHLYFQFVSDSDTDNRQFDIDAHENIYGDRPKRVLDLVYLMRSSDTGVGKSFNNSSYAALLAAIARLTGHAAGSVTAFTVDTHIYNDHFDPLQTYRDQYAELMEDYAMSRQTTRPQLYVSLDETNTLADITPDRFKLTDYNPKPFIKFPVAI